GEGPPLVINRSSARVLLQSPSRTETRLFSSAPGRRCLGGLEQTTHVAEAGSAAEITGTASVSQCRSERLGTEKFGTRSAERRTGRTETSADLTERQGHIRWPPPPYPLSRLGSPVKPRFFSCVERPPYSAPPRSI